MVNGVQDPWLGDRVAHRLKYRPQPLIQALEAVQSQVSSGPSSSKALAALEGASDDFVQTARLAAHGARRVVDGLRVVPGLQARRAQGAFFAWDRRRA